MNRDPRSLAHFVRRFAGTDGHAQFVCPPANAELRHAHLERRLAQIHHCGRLRIGNPSPYHQHRHKDVGRVISLHRHFHHRRGSRQRLHEGFDHALALDRDQRGGLLERHAHLQLRGLTRFVAFALRNEIHAVVVALVEPPRVLARYPGRAVGVGHVAVAILRLRCHEDVAGHRRLHRAKQASALVGLAGAVNVKLLDLDTALIPIKTADQPFSVREHVAHEKLHLDLLVADRLAGEVERDHPELEPFLRQRPGIRFDAQDHLGGPKRHPRRRGQDFAVRVRIFHFGIQFLWAVAGGQPGKSHAGRPGGIEIERDRLERAHAAARGCRGRCVSVVEFVVLRKPLISALLLDTRDYPAVGEGEAVVVSERHALRAQHRTHFHRRVPGATAGEITQAHVQVHALRLDLRCLRPRYLRLHQRHAEFLDAEPSRSTGIAARTR